MRLEGIRGRLTACQHTVAVQIQMAPYISPTVELHQGLAIFLGRICRDQESRIRFDGGSRLTLILRSIIIVVGQFLSRLLPVPVVYWGSMLLTPAGSLYLSNSAPPVGTTRANRPMAPKPNRSPSLITPV